MARRGLKASPGRVLVVLAEDTALSAARWLLTDPDRRVIQQGRVPSEGGASPPPAEQTVLLVAGQDVLTRRLSLPATRPAQRRSEALTLLQTQGLAATPDALQLIVAAPDMEGRRLVAALAPGVLDAWRAAAGRLGLTPDVILPDSLLPPPPSDEDWIALPLADRVSLRGRDAAVTAEPDLADLLVEGASVTVLDQAARIEAALIDTALAPPLNLLDGLAGPAEPRRWRLAVALAAALALSPLVLTAAQALRLDLMTGRLEHRNHEVMRQTWPDAPAGTAPLDEARRRLGPAGLSGGFTRVAAALFAAVEDMEGAQLQTLLLDETGALRATLAHADYGDTPRLDAALEPFGLAAEEEAVNEENGRVISDILVTPR